MSLLIICEHVDYSSHPHSILAGEHVMELDRVEVTAGPVLARW